MFCGLRHHARRISALSPPAVAAHGNSAAGLLSRRAGSRRHGKRCTDVFYHASGAQICTHSQLREHRLLGFYAKAVPHSRCGFRNGQRTSAAACPQSRAADGVRERAERPYLQLGHSSGGCWGVRLPRDCTDAVPAPLQLMEVPEGDYLVFEHGPFDLQTENSLVEAKIERAMRDFDYEAAGCCLDTAPGRVFYFVHDCVRFWKYIRPVVRF